MPEETVRLIRLVFPMGVSISLEGVVRHCRPVRNGMFECGVEFLNVRPEISEKLSKYVLGIQRAVAVGRKSIHY